MNKLYVYRKEGVCLLIRSKWLTTRDQTANICILNDLETSSVARGWQLSNHPLIQNLLPTDFYSTRAIPQYRKILIHVHVPRLIKYLKVEKYIREVGQKSERACLLVESDDFLFHKKFLATPLVETNNIFFKKQQKDI